MFQPVINANSFSGVQANYATPTGYAPFRDNGQETVGGFRYSPQGWGPFQSLRRSVGSNAYMDPNQMGFLNTQAPQHEIDAAASGLFKFGLPVVATGAVEGFGRAFGTESANSMRQGLSRFTGGIFSSRVTPFGRFGESFGSNLTSGTMRGLGFGEGAVAAGATTGGFVGSVVGGMALEAGALNATVSLLKQPFQGYGRSRNYQNYIGQSVAGVSFTGTQGLADTGKGLGLQSSARIGAQIIQTGQSDMFLTQKMAGEIGKSSFSLGLMDNVGNPQQIQQKLKAIFGTVKTFAEVLNLPSTQETMKLIANLNLAGASIRGGVASSFARNVANLGAIGGVSASELYNTVGQQGNYLAQSQGLTPYIGGIAEMTAAAGAKSAYRAGVLSPSLYAALGGATGIAQSTLSGNVAAVSSPFSSMYGAAQYTFGGGRQGNIAQMAGTLSANLARNPLGALGMMNYNANMVKSRMLKDPNAAIDQAAKYLNQLPPGMVKNSDGSYKTGAMMIALQNLGVDPNDARSLLANYAAQQTSQARLHSGTALANQQLVNSEVQMQHENETFGGIMKPVYSAIYSAGAYLKGAGAQANIGLSGVAQHAAGWWARIHYGSNIFTENEVNRQHAMIGALGDRSAYEAGKDVTIGVRFKRTAVQKGYGVNKTGLDHNPDHSSVDNLENMIQRSFGGAKATSLLAAIDRAKKTGDYKSLQDFIRLSTNHDISLQEAKTVANTAVSVKAHLARSGYDFVGKDSALYEKAYGGKIEEMNLDYSMGTQAGTAAGNQVKSWLNSALKNDKFSAAPISLKKQGLVNIFSNSWLHKEMGSHTDDSELLKMIDKVPAYKRAYLLAQLKAANGNHGKMIEILQGAGIGTDGSLTKNSGSLSTLAGQLTTLNISANKNSVEADMASMRKSMNAITPTMDMSRYLITGDAINDSNAVKLGKGAAGQSDSGTVQSMTITAGRVNIVSGTPPTNNNRQFIPK